jgi:uncharacterized protein (TIGR03643 family)
MHNAPDNYCYYSDLPSPMAYLEEAREPKKNELSAIDIDRIIEMAWEDRTPFDAIYAQFQLNESGVRALMKQQLKFSSYKRWRTRVETCKTKHTAKRSTEIDRFKSGLQRSITSNRISKR